jgi:hypothetical protein
VLRKKGRKIAGERAARHLKGRLVKLRQIGQ